MSDSDSENEGGTETQLLPATTELAQSAQKRTYKKHTENDRRRETSKANIEKARAARLDRIRKEKEAEKDKYVIEESSSEEDCESDTELVLKKAKKPKQLTEVEARMMKLELLLENLALQEKKKKLQDKKKPKKIEIEVKQGPAAPSPAMGVKGGAPANPLIDHMKKRMLLDL